MIDMQSDIDCKMLHNLDKDNPDYHIQLMTEWQLQFEIVVLQVNSTKDAMQKYQSATNESYTLDVYKLPKGAEFLCSYTYVISFGDTIQYGFNEPKEIIDWIEDNISQADICFYDEEIMNEWNR